MSDPAHNSVEQKDRNECVTWPQHVYHDSCPSCVCNALWLWLTGVHA